jgi:holin-like protein
MLHALATFLVCQLAGEALVRLVEIPVPGPVVGMVFLFVLLVWNIDLPYSLDETADGILKHLSLLFVPAGVGVVQHLDRFGAEGWRIALVVVVSTAITLAVTALTFAGVSRMLGDDGEGRLDVPRKKAREKRK